MLPGLAMGFNFKGLAFTVNTLVPKETLVNGTRKKIKILTVPKSEVVSPEKFLSIRYHD